MSKPHTPITSRSIYSGIRGFTLIEMMVVVMIIAILGAIAIPSYRQYVIKNAEREAQAKMLQLQIQLEQWRAKSLTYQGFVPQRGDGVCVSGNHCYDLSSKIIYVPDGSTSANHRYKITLVDGGAASASLVTATADTVDSTTGRSWKMLATPNSTGSVSTARRILLSSNGVQCITADSAVVITSTSCGTRSQNW